MMTWRTRLISSAHWYVLALLWLLMVAPLAVAQRPTEIGESVKVQFLGDWHDGTVVDQKKDDILVEFFFGGSSQQRVFKRREILRLYEEGCLDYGRVWTSSAGTQLEAAFKSFEGNQITLIKPDMEELTIPEDKLSKKDQAYLKKVKANYKSAVNNGVVAAAVPELPEMEQMAPQYTYSMYSEGGQLIHSLEPTPNYLKFQQAGAGIELVRRNQELVSVIPVGGPEQLVLMATHEDHFHHGDPFPSQLYWVSLAKKKVLSKIYISPAHRAMDYDPRTRRLLTFRPESFFDKSKAPSQYVLWDLKPGGENPVPILRWQANGMKWDRDYFAKIVDDDVIVAKTERRTYTAWNVNTKEEIYRFEQGSFFDSPVVQSRDRSFLIVPEDGSVSVVNARTGEFTMTLPVDGRHVSGANINPEGTRLAAITENSLYIWDLAAQDPNPRKIPAPLISSPFEARLDWIDDKHVLGETFSGRILFNIELGLPIWNYTVDLHHYFENKDPLKNFVLDGKYFYVARPTFTTIIAVGAIELPGPHASQVIDQVDQGALYAVKPGSRVGLKLYNVTDSEQIEAWLLEKIEEAGWIYDPDSDTQLAAYMGIGEEQRVTYKEIGGDQVTTVAFRPHYSRLRLIQVQDNKEVILWQDGTATGAPSVIRGSAAQRLVDRLQRPNTEFFSRVTLQSEILDPKYSRGFGHSRFGLRGLELVSANPPGRADNPYEAEQEARAQEDKDREKQRQQMFDGEQ